MALTAIVAAQDNTRGQAQQAPRQAGSGNYVDADNNGICDYYETNRQFNRGGRRMGNATAPGSRRGQAIGQGRGLRPEQGRGLGPGQGKGPPPAEDFLSMKIKTEYATCVKKIVLSNDPGLTARLTEQP